MSLTYFLYARRSSQGESKQVESIPDQLTALHQVRDSENLSVSVEFTEARSAMKPDKRPVFREMLDRIIAGEANAILCWHTNRLYRNEKEYGEVAYLLHIGVIQCIKTPEREYHPEDHGLLMAVEASTSTQYSRDLKRDVTRGVVEKAEKGWYPYKPKPGYLVEPITREVLPDPARFPLLRNVIGQVLSGIHSVEELRLNLNASGFRSPRNSNGGDKPMSRTSMYRFLSDRFYQGDFQFRGVWMEGRHRPLLTREEFAAIQKILRRPLRPNQKKNRFAYTGLMRCGLCGCQITAETHVKRYKTTGNSKSYTYYHCTLKRGCKQRSVTEEELEEQLLQKIEGARLDPFFIDWALAELKREATDQQALAAQVEPMQTTHLRTLTLKVDSLWEMRHAQEISGDEFRERKARYETEIRQLKERSARIVQRAERDRASVVKALTFSRDAYTKFTGGQVEERRQVAQELAESYVLTLDKLDIQVSPLIAKFLELEPKSHPPQQVGKGGPGFDNPIWRTILNDIRKVASDSDSSIEAAA